MIAPLKPFIYNNAKKLLFSQKEKLFLDLPVLKCLIYKIDESGLWVTDTEHLIKCKLS